MKAENWKEWAKAAGIRALKTFAQCALSMLGVGLAIQDVNWLNVLSVSAVAAIISILTSVAGLPEVRLAAQVKELESAHPNPKDEGVDEDEPAD